MVKNSIGYLVVIGLLFLGLAWNIKSVQAENFVGIRSLSSSSANNFTYQSPEGDVSLALTAGAIKTDLTFRLTHLVERDRVYRYFTYPEGRVPASDLYSIRYTPETAGNFDQTPVVTLKYDSDSQYKEAYYYNWSELRFEKLESERDPLAKTLTFSLPDKKKVIFALFSEPEIAGKASWYVHYKYPGELVAASRDFAEDTKLRVTNLENDKFVVVTVKDYGPKECKDWTEEEQKKMGPCQDRVIDLSKTAFQVLAEAWEGVINVKVSIVEQILE